ncbi:MAG: cytochrome c family protein [Rhodospirillales bacterium]|nr:cytochrome c family protein [Rhodospirillales bacterium]|tara:strand:- start:1243 stop:1767 length:525 start_codon:yes stop_codon:yes gene_type:complete
MSSFEINKIVGAVLAVALVVVVIGMIGDVLVKPKDHAGATIVTATPTLITKKVEKKLDPIGPMLASADIKKGRKIANQCGSCHTFNKGGKNKIGPALWKILDRDMGGLENYKYSSAIKAMKKKWGYEELNAFLLKPRKYIKGTKMAYVGLKKASDRANLIVFLRSLSDMPKPLP